MAVVGQLEVQILADIAQLKTDMEKALSIIDKTTKDAESHLKKLSDSALTVGKAIRTAAYAFGAWKLYEFAKEATMLSARYETLGISMVAVGRNAGYSAQAMEDAARGMQKMGISMVESRQQAMRMVQANIDLEQSQKLARIAQDAAVIGNMNSSQAFARMIHGIQTGQTDVLRMIGLQVNLEGAYKKHAETLKVKVNQMTQAQRAQAVLNSVMDEGVKIAGTYEAAMGTAGKQINSMERYVEDLKIKMGATFNEVLTVAVMGLTDELKNANGELDEMAKNRQLESWGRSLTDVFVALVNWINNVVVGFRRIDAAMANTQVLGQITRKALVEQWEAYKKAITPGGSTQAEFNAELNRIKLQLKTDTQSQEAQYNIIDQGLKKQEDRYEDAARVRRAAVLQQKAAADEQARLEKESFERTTEYWKKMVAAGKLAAKDVALWTQELQVKLGMLPRTKADLVLARDARASAGAGGGGGKGDDGYRLAEQALKAALDKQKAAEKETVAYIDFLRRSLAINEIEYIKRVSAAELDALELAKGIAQEELATAIKFKKDKTTIATKMEAVEKAQREIDMRTAKRDQEELLLIQKEALEKATQAAQQRNKSDAEGIALRDEMIQKDIQGLDAQTKAISETIEGMKNEVETRGKLKSQIAQMTVLRLEEKRASLYGEIGSDVENPRYKELKALDALIAKQRELVGLLQGQELYEANQKAAEEAKKSWEQVGQSLVDNLMKGGKSVAQYLKDLFRTLVLKPILEPVGKMVGSVTQSLYESTFGPIIKRLTSSITNTLTGGIATLFSGGAVAGETGGGGLLNSASTLWSGVKQGFSWLTGGATTAGVNLGSYAAAVKSAELATIQMGGSVAGASSAFATAVPYVAGALLVLSALNKKGETRSGGQYAYDQATGLQFLRGPSGGDPVGTEARQAINATLANINEMFAQIGSNITVSAFTGGYESSGKGRGGVYAGGTLSTGATFGEWTGLSGNAFETTSTRSPGMEEAFKNFGTDLAQATIQALQAASKTVTTAGGHFVDEVTTELVNIFEGGSGAELWTTVAKTKQVWVEGIAQAGEAISEFPQIIRDMVAGVDAEALSDSDAQALVAKIKEIIIAVAGFREGVDNLPFEHLRDRSFDAAAGLIKMAGGLDQLMTGLNQYYENFYSNEEKRLQTAKNISAQLAKVGVSWTPEEILNTANNDQNARQAFRAMVEANKAYDQTYIALTLVAGAFAELIPEAENAADAIGDIENSLQGLQDTNRDLLLQLAQAKNDLATIRQIETKGFTSAEEFALYDANELLKDQISHQENANNLTQTGISLEIQLARVRKNTNELRRLETLGYNEAELALYDHNVALQTLIDNLSNATNLLSAAYNKQTSELRENITELEISAKKYRSFSQDIRRFKDELTLGELSPLTPAQKYAQARSIAAETYGKALAGDEAAMTLLPMVSRDFLEASQNYYASSDQYQADFAWVQQYLALGVDKADVAADWAEQQVTVAKDQLAYLDKMVSGLININNSVLTVAEAISALGSLAPAGTASVVADVYQRVLGRAPDQEGGSYWSAQAAQGATVADIVSGITNSSEFVSRINAGYQELLGRDVDPSGLDYWQSAMQAGATIQDLYSQIMASPEYLSRQAISGQADSNSIQAKAAEYIKSAYTTLLSRQPDEQGLAYWIQQAISGATETDLTMAIMNSEEFKNRMKQLLAAGYENEIYNVFRWGSLQNGGAGVVTLGLADRIMGWGDGTAAEWARLNGLPVFHRGTDFVERTGLAFLERGEAVTARSANFLGGNGAAAVVARLEVIAAKVDALVSQHADGTRALIETQDRAANRIVDGTRKSGSRAEFNREQAQRAKA